MSDCLHFEINQLVQERIERGDTDLAEMASMMVENLADLVSFGFEHKPHLLLDATHCAA
jgi:hypothetical protein